MRRLNRKLGGLIVTLPLLAISIGAGIVWMALQGVGRDLLQQETPLASPTLKPSRTPTPQATRTPTAFPSASATPTPTGVSVPTPTPGGEVEPYPDAPLCSDHGDLHDVSLFHTLWDGFRGCHYDHEHGESPFTAEIAAAFPGFDLLALLGGVEIGSTNPSSPIENTVKHGGMKWQKAAAAPHGCEVGFESSTVAIDAYALQYHNFGNYAVELEGRIHSVAGLLRQCKPGDPSDKGYIYTVQHVDYGQRVSGYQGDIVPYPDTPLPAYDSRLGPYVSVNCINRPAPPCGSLTTRQAILDANQNTNSIWTSKSSFRVAPSGSPLLAVLFRLRDTYQILDWNDAVHPFIFLWMCSNDGGLTYAAQAGCRYNNSTSTVHEVTGVIPASWDNLLGFDTEPQVGRITAEGYVTRFGTLNLTCTTAGTDCHPIKMVRAFVGSYGSELSAEKVSNPTPANTPDREIFWCGVVACAETDAGAVSSAWIGSQN